MREVHVEPDSVEIDNRGYIILNDEVISRSRISAIYNDTTNREVQIDVISIKNNTTRYIISNLNASNYNNLMRMFNLNKYPKEDQSMYKKLMIYLHDGNCDSYSFYKDFDEYKVNDNALILMNYKGAWIAWYNLNDIQKWMVE